MKTYSVMYADIDDEILDEGEITAANLVEATQAALVHYAHQDYALQVTNISVREKGQIVDY